MLNLFYFYTNFIIRRKNKRRWLHKLDKHVYILEELTYNKRPSNLLYSLWYYGKRLPLRLLSVLLPLPALSHIYRFSYRLSTYNKYWVYYWFVLPGFLFTLYALGSVVLRYFNFSKPKDYAQYQDLPKEPYDPYKRREFYDRFESSSNKNSSDSTPLAGDHQNRRSRSSRPNFRDYL